MGWRRKGQWLSLVLSSMVVAVVMEASAGSESEVVVRFVKAPHPLSALDSATFEFEVLEERNGVLCSDCTIRCKLDGNKFSDCDSRQASYRSLSEGDHMFEACIDGYREIHCASYNWTVDTVSPTAYVSAPMPFTNKSNVSVHILFSEPCVGEGGFRCSPDYCSLLVYGAGNVSSSTLRVLQPDLEFSVNVEISPDVEYGRLVLVMDKNFCTDAAGNRFTRTMNSSFLLHFDRRQVSMKIRTRIPETFLQLDGKMRKATATNNQKQLKIYLYFSQQILNSSLEILNVLHTSSGILIPTNGSTLNSRRFGYKVTGVSSIDIVTIYCETNTILSRQGSPVLAADPFTFLYDVQRPTVRLRTTADMRTREHNIPVIIKFVKPVFEFNSSSALISGGHLLSFHEISRSMYIVIIHAEDSIVSIEVPENSARDVAGNSNLESNRLQVTHYSVPVISSIVSTIATAAFALTSMMALFLTVSTASLLSTGVFARTMTYLISEPTKNLARIACHIQVFALSKWLAVTLPVEYYELARGIGWSIPYLNLPWETKGMNIFAEDSGLPVVTYSKTAERNELNSFARMVATNVEQENKLHGKPLTPIEYRLFLENQNMMPEAEFIMVSRNSDVWKKFGRNMFWLAVIGGGFVALHFIFLLMLRFKRKRMEKQKEFGALALPRFEIILLLLANPCICQASATLIRGQSTATTAVGAILLGVAASILVALLLFLSTGITLGKLLHYKEVHQEGQEFHWYHELIRVSLGPGKRGQWSWKNQSSSVNLARLGPLFEDLRGPPKYMLSQIAGGGNVGKQGDRIIASEDENEDAKAPFIQKLFGILRIYYTFIESAKRASLGVVAGTYSSENASKVPSLVVLSITSFQLLFLLLKKPFIKKKVQMVEIISVACEAGVLGACLVLLEEEFSVSSRRRIGYLMISLFVLSFVSQMMNEWYALYKQTVRLSPAGNSFCVGLKTSFFGLLLLVLPSNLLQDLKEFGATQGDGEGGELPLPPRGARHDSGEKPWLRQLRELAKASFSKEEGGIVNDPSSSRNWSGGLCAGKKSSSSSVTSSSDFKAKGEMKTKAKGLYRDLEAIFASK